MNLYESKHLTQFNLKLHKFIVCIVVRLSGSAAVCDSAGVCSSARGSV
jgi:hypothetical protein